VKAAVKAWGAASDLDAAAQALADARRDLDPALLPELRTEVAEISAECLVEVLALEKDVVRKDPVEILGLPLFPKQVERVGAWLHDQAPTAAALGVDLPTWSKLLEVGMERYRAAQLGLPAPPSSLEGAAALAKNIEQARSLIDASAPSKFENRAAPGTSKKAGLLGMLAARRFKDGGEK
jgi:hypothetical protein